MAAEVLCNRWTLLLVRELMLGSSHFNDLRRGVPRMSSALLAKRLKELEAGGIVARTAPARAAMLQVVVQVANQRVEALVGVLVGLDGLCQGDMELLAFVTGKRIQQFILRREIAIERAAENPRLDHRITRHLQRVMFAVAKQRGGHREHRRSLERFDRDAGGDAAVQRDLDHVVGGFWERTEIVRLRGGRATLFRPFGHLEHFERARPIGQTTQELALLECRDQAVHARFRLEIERFLHFLERGRNAGFGEPVVDEADEFVLLLREHDVPPSRTDAEPIWNIYRQVKRA